MIKKILPYLLACIVGVVYISQVSAVFDEKLDLNGDNIYYYSLGQALSQGKGFTTITSCDPAPHMHFPCGYPAFMSVLMRCGIDSVHAMKVTNCVLLGISLLIIFWLLSAYSVWLATAVTLAAACHAELLHWASIMMSEMLYLTCCLLLIVAIVRWPKFKYGVYVQTLVVAFLAGYIYFVRSMGASMILAAIVYTLGHAIIRKQWQSLCLAVALVVGLGIAKTSWDARNERISPGHQSDYVGDFMKKPGGEVMSTTEDWVNRVENNLKSYTVTYVPDALFELKDPNPNAEHTVKEYVAGGLLIVLVAVGLLLLGEMGWLLLLYVGATWCVLMVWPEQYAGIRYFVTLIPLLIIGLFSCAYHLVACSKWHEIVPNMNRWLVPTCVVAAMGACLCFTVPRYIDAQGYYRKMAKVRRWQQVNNPPMQQFLAAAEWCGKNLAPDARIMCRKPEIFYMFSHYHPASGQPHYASEEEVMRRLRDGRIDYVLIDWWFPHAYRTIYPAIVANAGQFRIIQQWGEYNPSRGAYPTLLVAYTGEKGTSN